MKYIPLLLCLFFSALNGSAQVTVRQSVKLLDDKNGFRDLKFGTPLSEIKGLVSVEGSTKYFTRPDDAMTVGESTIKTLVYGFYDGRLMSVRFSTEGLANSYHALQALQASYGQGSKPNEYIEEYHWGSNKVSMNYEENPISHDADISIFDRALFARMMADGEKKAKAAKSDL